MNEKQKERILYPRWLTKKQIDLLRHAEKGELPGEVEEKLKKALDPATPWKSPRITIIFPKGQKRKAEVIEFTDRKENRFALFLKKEFGPFFGVILFSRFIEYGNFPKAEAEKNSLYMMKHFSLMRKATRK